MQLNKVFKEITLLLSILTVAACNSKKSNDKIDTENNVIDDNNASLSVGKLAHEEMQKLQSNNIIYFGFDKYDVIPEYTQILDQHAAFLRGNPSIQITIEGHTDERGTPEYNIVLGERRANAVKMYLQSKGVNNEQITVISYGKEKPAILDHDEIAYIKNRRAVLVY